MIVYRATNLVNGKKYVGITTRILYIRIRAHKNDAKRGSGYAFHAAIRKHGIDNFRFEIIDHAISLKSLFVKEQRWIKELKTQSPNGYNITRGGQGCIGRARSTQELIELQRKAIGNKWACGSKRDDLAALNRRRTGKRLCASHRRAISKSLLANTYCVGRKPWNKGKHASIESRAKMRCSALKRLKRETRIRDKFGRWRVAT